MNATNVHSVCQSVSLSVCLSRGFTRLRCANAAGWIQVPFGVELPGDLTNIELDGSHDSMRPSPSYFGHFAVVGLGVRGCHRLLTTSRRRAPLNPQERGREWQFQIAGVVVPRRQIQAQMRAAWP